MKKPGNYSSTKEPVIPQESFFQFKHFSGAKKDSSRMTFEKVTE